MIDNKGDASVNLSSEFGYACQQHKESEVYLCQDKGARSVARKKLRY
jgi:hypothetical protein